MDDVTAYFIVFDRSGFLPGTLSVSAYGRVCQLFYWEIVMNLLKVGKVSLMLLGVLAVLGTVTVAQAVPISFSGSYDGSYYPYSATPPTGQSTWLQGSATLAPIPNNDNGTASAGVANFNDLATDDRMCAYRLMGSGTFSSDQANDEYVYSARLKLYSDGLVAGATTLPVVAFGFRDEWSGGTDNGKVVLLGIYNSSVDDDDKAGVYFVNKWIHAIPSQNINHVNYFDNQWHTYQVEKYLSEGIAKLDVSIDGNLLYTTNYSQLENAYYNTSGFGYFGGTSYTNRVTVDYFQYGAAVPEPSTLALLASGLIGLLAYAWRKRK